MVDNATKKCHICRQVLPLDAFHRWKASPDGRQYTCKACKKAQAEIRQHKLRDVEMATDGTKKCNVCGKILPLDAFAVRRASPDGRQYDCRECMAIDRSPDSHMTQEQKIEAQTLWGISVHCGWEPGYDTLSWSEIFERFPACTACEARYHIHEYPIIDGVRSTLCKFCIDHDIDLARITYDEVPDFCTDTIKTRQKQAIQKHQDDMARLREILLTKEIK